MRRWVLGATFLAGLGAAGAYAGLLVMDAAGPLAHEADVVVPRGGSEVVGRALLSAGVLNSVAGFRIAAALTAWQGKLRSAELAFPAGASVAQVLAALRAGRPVQHLLTIAEGLTAGQIGALLARAPGLTGEIVLPDEGGALPESYAYTFGMNAGSVVLRAGRAMQERLLAAWAARDRDVALRSPGDMLILASLVERETHLGQERALVARVFLNRLRLGMRLQSDPTVIYAESGGDLAVSGLLTREALVWANPYNTYVVTGLPAGPICSPGAASIEAVAHPARSAALYFVADGSGGHAFADSLEEHVRNVKRYRALLH